MSETAQTIAGDYNPRNYKSDLKPVWCPGCGDFGVLNSVTKALAGLKLAPEQVAMVSGIGCSSRIPPYTRVYGFHGAHGRALPVATGLALARPDLVVLAAGGDGDILSIGGNHFIHTCRRNVNMTCLLMDNAVYGMTKGQPSPTTECGWEGSKLAPRGHEAAAFRPLEMALAAGATFIARSFSGEPNALAELIATGIRHPGFAFIQILSPCPTYRPEQMQYKKIVHPGFELTSDRRQAYLQLMEDDGFATGLLFRGSMPTCVAPSVGEAADIDTIQQQFVVR